MTHPLIALVTGGNKGIGFEVCRQLARKGYSVILTSRDREKGEKAQRSLKREDLSVHLELLTVDSDESIESFSSSIASQFERLDVLVNNAGTTGSRKGIGDADTSEIMRVMNTNFIGPLKLTRTLLPLIRKSDDGRIINVSSGMGSWEDLGDGYASYRLSKVGLNAMTIMFAADLSGTSIRVNAVCPGWVRTDMGGRAAPRTVEKGAESIVWLATAPEIPNGAFIRDKKEIKW